jgi:hypothetical protein
MSMQVYRSFVHKRPKKTMTTSQKPSQLIIHTVTISYSEQLNISIWCCVIKQRDKNPTSAFFDTLKSIRQPTQGYLWPKANCSDTSVTSTTSSRQQQSHCIFLLLRTSDSSSGQASMNHWPGAIISWLLNTIRQTISRYRRTARCNQICETELTLSLYPHSYLCFAMHYTITMKNRQTLQRIANTSILPLDRRSERRGEEKILNPTGTRTPTPQSSIVRHVASRYTDCATPAPSILCIQFANSMVQVQLSLCLINWASRHEDVCGSGGKVLSFLTSPLDGCERSLSRPGRFTPRKESLVPIG